MPCATNSLWGVLLKSPAAVTCKEGASRQSDGQTTSTPAWSCGNDIQRAVKHGTACPHTSHMLTQCLTVLLTCCPAGRLVVHKPDLPPSLGPPAPPTRLGGVGPLPAGLSPRASRGASVAALREYGGPNAFAIPGNHGGSLLLGLLRRVCVYLAWDG